MVLANHYVCVCECASDTPPHLGGVGSSLIVATAARRQNADLYQCAGLGVDTVPVPAFYPGAANEDYRVPHQHWIRLSLLQHCLQRHPLRHRDCLR